MKQHEIAVSRIHVTVIMYIVLMYLYVSGSMDM